MPKGYFSASDVNRTTADGRNLNELYAELAQVAELHNEQQANFLSLFTYPVTSPVVSVLQTVNGTADVFEVATEYGVPQGSRFEHDTLNMGSTFQWYDGGWRSTWRYLIDADEADITAATTQIITADQDQVFKDVMATVFRNTKRNVVDAKSDAVYDVFSFANGDGWVPPSYAGNDFSGSHTHYRTSGAAAVTSGDLDEIVDDFKSHGYSAENGTQVVIFVSSTEANRIARFRVADGDRGDFIPASGARFYAPNQLVGDQPANTFAGFPVKGAYEDALIIESSRIPIGYVTALASGGKLATTNPIMLREHPRIKGLTLVKGGNADYPLQDSYWTHGYGTGVRQRLAGMVMQITDAPTYTPPALYVA